MFKKSKNAYHITGAAITVGMLTAQAGSAQAAAGGGGATNNFGSIAYNINQSISSLPGLVSSIAYLFGVLLAVLGILKIKDHVENPTQTPLKEGAIRLASGGALFGLPIVIESMFETIGEGAGASTAVLQSVSFGTK